MIIKLTEAEKKGRVESEWKNSFISYSEGVQLQNFTEGRLDPPLLNPWHIRSFQMIFHFQTAFKRKPQREIEQISADLRPDLI